MQNTRFLFQVLICFKKQTAGLSAELHFSEWYLRESIWSKILFKAFLLVPLWPFLLQCLHEGYRWKRAGLGEGTEGISSDSAEPKRGDLNSISHQFVRSLNSKHFGSEVICEKGKKLSFLLLLKHKIHNKQIAVSIPETGIKTPFEEWFWATNSSCLAVTCTAYLTSMDYPLWWSTRSSRLLQREQWENLSYSNSCKLRCIRRCQHEQQQDYRHKERNALGEQKAGTRGTYSTSRKGQFLSQADRDLQDSHWLNAWLIDS